MDPSRSKMAEGEGSFPAGFRFTPTKEQLVKYYLLPRLQGRPPVPIAAVIEANVYLWHPDRLIGMYRDRGEDSWYFLSPRARKYTNGDRPSRQTEDGLGRWKASTGMAAGKAELGDGTKFFHRVLGYHDAPIETETRTKWLMQELTIPEFEKKVGETSANPSSSLDEYVMCKIYISPRRKWNNDDEAGTSEEPCPPAAAAESGGQAGASNKQAGKRPVEEKPAPEKRARQRNQAGTSRTAAGLPAPPLHAGGTDAPSGTAAAESGGQAGASNKQAGKRRVEEKEPRGAPKKRAGQHSQAAGPSRTAAGPPAPPLLHAGGTRTPARTAAVCYVRPTVYNVDEPMPQPLAYQRPPTPGHLMPPVVYNNGVQAPAQRPQTVAYNNGMQVPAQRQQTVAYNGQVRPPVQRPQTVPYNGHLVRPPVQRPQTQTVPYNGQLVRPPVQRPQTVPYNGQVRPPVQRPQTVPYNGQTRPPASVLQSPALVLPSPAPVLPTPAPVLSSPPSPSVLPSPAYEAENAAGPRGHGMATMWRLSNPSGGQEVEPPSVPQPPAMREQPETEEQRKERVCRQLVEEWQRLQKEGLVEPYAAGQ